METAFKIEEKYTSILQDYRKDETRALTKQRVLMVSDDFLPAKTGVGSYIQQTATDLAARGHHVVIVTSRRPGQPAQENWKGVIVYRLFSIKIADFYQVVASQKQIVKIIKEHQINLIHHNYISFLLQQAYKAGKELGLPQIYTCHMSVVHITQPWFMRPFRALIEMMLRRQYQKFDFILSPSRAVADEVKSQGITRPILTLSNPIKMGHPKMLSGKIQKRSEFQVLYAGRLAPEKNIPLLIRSMRQLKDKYPEASLAIAGAGVLRESLEKLVHQLSLQDCVYFLGQLNSEDLACEYANCDVFVLPSTLETQGIVVLEAMSFAKPVILTRANACAAELVEPDQNGFIVDAYNPAELSTRLSELARSASLREKLGANSLERSVNYDPDKIVTLLQIVYQAVT